MLGFLVPERAWRWAFVPFGAQALVGIFQNPTANLLPIGLIVFAFFGVACLVPAYIGAKLARVMRRSTDGDADHGSDDITRRGSR